VPSTASAVLTPPMTSATRALQTSPTQPISGPPIGVVPAIATTSSEMTRPRIAGAEFSCSSDVATDRNETLDEPSRNSSTRATRRVGARPVAVRSTAKPSPPSSSRLAVARRVLASANAPRIAPMPMAVYR
jgi:hypothetical protein